MIPLTKGIVARVDADDYDRVAQFRWHASRQGYAVRALPGRKKQIMHRMLLDAPEGVLVDHINGDKADNRRCNLRLCTTQQNGQNRHRVSGSSRFKGVSWDRGKWRATICVGQRQRSLGRYPTEIEAAAAYDRASRELFGQYARPNFPVLP